MHIMSFNWKNIKIEDILPIAIEAGEKIMDIYENEDFSKIVDFKSDNSPLTLADKEANIIIERGLSKLASIPILSEEGREIGYEERKNWTHFWVVDPLDGTKEFIKKNGQFTVNIALIEGNAPVIGVIYAPAQDVLYYAKKGEGAYKKKGTEVIVLSTKKKESGWISVGSSSHSAPEEVNILKKYPVVQSTAIGSSLKFCLLAEGKADIYYRHGPTMEWDTAAGQAILEISGGKMVDSNNEIFTYNKESLLNGSFLCLAYDTF
jgi:3'(2'), 5'-bisphosphate nucleotidase